MLTILPTISLSLPKIQNLDYNMQYIVERKYIFYRKPRYHSFMLSFTFFFTFFLSIMLVSPQAVAIPNIENSQLPIKVNSDNMSYNMEKSTVSFSGSVVVTRGEFTLNSNEMQIFLKKEQNNENTDNENLNLQTNNSQENIPLTGKVSTVSSSPIQDTGNIEKIDAIGNVKFFYGNQSGSSEKATYQASKNLLTLTGNPIVKDGENTIQGNIIHYYVNERRSEVIGSKGKRVEAIFTNE